VDLQVLHRKLPDWRPAQVIDTLRLARTLLPSAGSHRLMALAGELGLNPAAAERSQPHRAAYDALLAAHLLMHLAQLGGRPLTWQDLCALGGQRKRAEPPDARAAVLF
jgi:DNA polymerase-3 subunit epsilon/exodeoxyribonuclease X